MTTSLEPLTCSLCGTAVFPIVSNQPTDDPEVMRRVCQGCVDAAARETPSVKVSRKKA